MTAVIQVDGLRKVYWTAFHRRRVEALKGVSFSVQEGEIFGFLGPNGAGKTTTIRILMGLISPSAGNARIFGHPIPSRAARSRLGFLPEAPYFYDYLTVAELLDLAGRLFGMPRRARARRAAELIELVGLGHARKNPLKSFSKGMLQRAGIAQALMNDPELVVLDEPMSGLDPIGRKEVRDIILALRDDGKTVFFSSHILADVESLADRIAIVGRGRVRDVGKLRELVQGGVAYTDVVLRVGDETSAGIIADALAPAAEEVRRQEDELVCRLDGGAEIDDFVRAALDAGGRLVSVTPHHETLEDVFLRSAAEDDAEARA